ncbi:MAG: hypothetical protein JSS66_00135 [Armatimonadetes bacterium]|nr:hypothetical protein [Armatimonadota bacterium]
MAGYKQFLGWGFGATNQSSALVYVTKDHSAGNPLLLSIANYTSNRTVSSIVDSRGNTYNFLGLFLNIGAGKVHHYVSDGATALASGDSVTVNFSSTTASIIGLMELQGVTTTLDSSGGASATSTTIAGTTVTSAASTLIAATYARAASAMPSGVDEAYTTVVTVVHPISNLQYSLAYLHQIPAGSSTISNSFPTSAAWVTALTSLPFSSSPSVTPVRVSTLMLLGAG